MEPSKELLEEIERVKVWHHRIDLGGTITPGLQDTNQVLADIGLPESLHNQDVLDLGARDGFFSFECERRGANRVVALDYVPSSMTGFDLCKRVLGSSAEWANANVYQIGSRFPESSFDVVLFLGLIYHLRHPLLALDRIHNVLKPGGVLLIESHLIDEGLVDASGAWSRLDDYGERLSSFALAQFYTDSQLGNDPTSPWAPNLQGLLAVVRAAGFEVLSSWRNSFRGGCTARKIELPANHPKYIDVAESFDMHGNWRIERPGAI